jgi:hypothetical protein
LKYSEFASRTIYELFPAEDLKKSLFYEFNFSSTIIAVNNGKGQFTIKLLPLPVQLSSVNAVAITDVNSDGKPDLLLGGNQFDFLPQFGRLDASFGHLLINMGNNEFEWIDNKQFGIEVRGVVKDLKQLEFQNKSHLLLLQNNLKPLLFSLSTSHTKK